MQTFTGLASNVVPEPSAGQLRILQRMKLVGAGCNVAVRTAGWTILRGGGRGKAVGGAGQSSAGAGAASNIGPVRATECWLTLVVLYLFVLLLRAIVCLLVHMFVVTLLSTESTCFCLSCFWCVWTM